MPEPIKFSLNEAALSDGTIDFYAMLVEVEDAPTEQLHAKIQQLYSESQANRDHRNLARRREYQTLLELLPGARAALLDVEKRQRYNAYLAAAKAGTNTPEFEEFMTDLMGLNEKMEERTGLLGTQEKQSAEARTRPAKTTAAKTPTKAAPAPTARPGAVAPLAIVGGVGGVIAGVLLGLAFKNDIVVGLLLGIIMGAVLFVVLNNKGGTKVGR